MRRELPCRWVLKYKRARQRPSHTLLQLIAQFYRPKRVEPCFKQRRISVHVHAHSALH